MTYPNSTELIRTFVASFRNSPNITLLGSNVYVHFLYEDMEYYVYLKCVTYAGRPYPENVTRAQLSKRTEFNEIIKSNARFLFIGYDIYNQVYVCWEPNKAKSRLNKKSYVSFFSRKSVQESVEAGNIVQSTLTNGDVFVTFKKEDINVFFLTIENFFDFEEEKFESNNSTEILTDSSSTEQETKVSGVLDNVDDDQSVKLLIDELSSKDPGRMAIIAACINSFGSFYPKMGFNLWKSLIYRYLDKTQQIIVNELPIVLENKHQIVSETQKAEYFLQLKSKTLTALAIFVDGCFTVLEGSEASVDNATSIRNPEKRNAQLAANAHKDGNVWILDNDVTFKSPSTAAVFCFGRSSNGWAEWVDQNNVPLKDIFIEQEKKYGRNAE